MSALVGTRGRVTIEEEIRDRLGIEPGWRAFQRIEEDRVVLEFRPPRRRRSLAGVLADKATQTFPTEEALEAATEEAWSVAAGEVASREVTGG